MDAVTCAYVQRQADGVLAPVMKALAGGVFVMGDEGGRGDERPAHRVRVDAFDIAVCPVTNAEYAQFLGDTGHAPPVHWDEARFDQPDLPVCGTSWLDAVAYADWLGARVKRRYHLPTEAQREYAARGGAAGRAYPWGEAPLPLEGPYERGLSGPSTGGPMPVTTGPAGANGFGLYHMADNVHEWCADWYDAGHYRARAAGAGDRPTTNPRGPGETDRRAARGGSWRHDVKFCRCAARSSLGPDKRFADFGFRLASSDGFEYLY